VTLQAAIGELLRPQQLRVHYLPGLPAEYYTATAPCLLAQLTDALTPSAGSGGRKGAASRIPVNADAWDLLVEIATNVHGWADHLGVDRKPYRAAPALTVRTAGERLPDWQRRLGPYMGRPSPLDGPGDIPPPRREDLPAAVEPPTPAAPLFAVRLDEAGPFAHTGIPPLGHLLRAVAAQAVAANQQAIADRLERKAGQWATRIRTMLAALAADERVYPQRGVPCPACAATAAFEDRGEDGTYRVPALLVWFAADEGADPDDLWLYRHCRACGDEGWVEYTTETGEPCGCACHVGGSYRPPCDVTGGCGSIGCDGRGTVAGARLDSVPDQAA
jgi:hypothetical protein